MCIIQILTTCTCCSAYKLVVKSNMCPWVHAYVSCKKWEWISNTRAPLSRQNIEMPGFLILVNPKLVWNSRNLACYHGAASTCRGKKFVPFAERSGISFSQTRASQNKHDGSGRERPTFGDETISIASYCFQKKFSCQHRTRGVLRQFLGFFGVRLVIFMH